MTWRTSVPALAIVAGLTLAGGSACAADWRDRSSRRALSRFAPSQFGQPFWGEFKRFSGHIAFNPGPAPTGDVKIEIDVASLKTGAADRDAQAQGTAWFATAKTPLATFTAARFRRIDDEHYEAFGNLAIKDAQVQIVLPFTLRIGADGVADMHGTVTLDRLAFGLGAGSLADPAMVGRQVAVDVHLRATPESERR